MLKYAAIADDLTGATTVGVLLARSGIRTAAFFDKETIMGFEHDEYLAICLSTDSRAETKEEAYKIVTEVTKHLKSKGVKYFSKRIDTTMRGGIGTEIDAMLSVLDKGIMTIVVPSMPQSRRIVVGGYSIIDNVPLSKTSVSMDVKTPVTESFLPDLLQAQTSRKVGHIGLKSVLNGTQAVISEIIKAKEAGCEILVCDAVTLEDIQVLAESVLEMPLPVLAVDPGPFTTALALKREKISRSVGQPDIFTDRNFSKTVIVVAGSATPVTRSQMQKLKESRNSKFVMIDPVKLIADENSREYEKDRVKREMEKIVDEVPVLDALILESSDGCNLELSKEDELHGYSPGTCSKLINDAMADVAASVIEKAGEARIAGFYTTGGDTMESVCRRLGIGAIEMIDYIIPQADLGRFIGKYEGMPIVGKGGLTGSEETACDIVDRIIKESLRLKSIE